jgi:hypothetical protein
MHCYTISGTNIGVFDTVASPSDTGSLVILFLAYLLIHATLAAVLAFAFAPFAFWYWFGRTAVWTNCAVASAYVYTHLKFALRPPGYFFWDIVHLTKFHQKFYDEYLNPLVKYRKASGTAIRSLPSILLSRAGSDLQ